MSSIEASSGGRKPGGPSAVDLSPVDRRVLDNIDEVALVNDLIDLVRVPSVTGTDAESELQHRFVTQFEQVGLEVDLWPLDLEALRADPDFPGTEVERLEGWGVVATAPGAGVPAMVLQGHVDVVPVGDLANWVGGDPYSAHIDGDVLHGRGACDMKAGLAVNLAVARALHRSGVRTERRFALHTVVSEEDGGLGAFATLRRGHGGEVAIITEPTSGRVITANAGALTFRIDVHGRAAHGSTRNEGVSAIEVFWPIHQALREFEARRNRNLDSRFAGHDLPYGISIGRISAGDWASSVPDLLSAEGRYGVRLGEDPVQARAAFEEAVRGACVGDAWLRDHPPTITWPGGQFASGAIETGHSLISEVISAASAVTGVAPREAAAPYGSDLRLYNGIGGIPTLHYGPGDVRYAHAPREQVSITETIAVARALALVTARRIGAYL